LQNHANENYVEDGASGELGDWGENSALDLLADSASKPFTAAAAASIATDPP
jgi:hypothetical protein